MIGNKLTLAILLGASTIISGCMSTDVYCPDCTPAQQAKMNRLMAESRTADQKAAEADAEREQAAYRKQAATEDCIRNYEFVRAQHFHTDADIKRICSR